MEPTADRIAMNGVTGRMGYNQHLVRSDPWRSGSRRAGHPSGEVIWPEPVLVGRNETSCARSPSGTASALHHQPGRRVAERTWRSTSTRSSTQLHDKAITRAIEAGKHIYAESRWPGAGRGTAPGRSPPGDAGVCTGIVATKLFLLPAQAQAAAGRRLHRPGALGARRVRYWVFRCGDGKEAQRPSWNYRTEDGGGGTLDMFCHWDYVLTTCRPGGLGVRAERGAHPGAGGRVRRALHRHRRRRRHASSSWDGAGRPVIAQINSSWAVRVFRTNWSSSSGRQPRAARSPGCAADGAAPVDDAKPCGTRTWPTRWTSARSGPRCRTMRSRQRLQGAVGSSSSGTWCRRAVELRLHLRRPRWQLAELGLRSAAEAPG